jgi:hypothetical protein
MRQIQEVRSNAANSRSPILCGKFKKSDLMRQIQKVWSYTTIFQPLSGSYTVNNIPSPGSHVYGNSESHVFDIQESYQSPIFIGISRSSLRWRPKVRSYAANSELRSNAANPKSNHMWQTKSPILGGNSKVRSYAENSKKSNLMWPFIFPMLSGSYTVAICLAWLLRLCNSSF